MLIQYDFERLVTADVVDLLTYQSQHRNSKQQSQHMLLRHFVYELIKYTKYELQRC